MKGVYSKTHVGLLALGLGIAAVYLWNGMSVAWGEVAVELPQANAEVLPVFPAVHESERKLRYMCDDISEPADHAACLDQAIFEGRDLASYDFAGVVGCGVEDQKTSNDRCEADYKRARDFVWKHWTQKKSGYIEVRKRSIESARERTTHLFIEPDEAGKWRIVERTVPMLVPEDAGELRLDDLIEVDWEILSDLEEPRVGYKRGTKVLRLTDLAGNSLIL